MSPPPAPPPPGSCERVRAASALVLAPHFDDEVLGCGGLLAQLTAAGATVRVLFLTDGGGGREAVSDRDSYRLRRRQEALAAAAVLGIAGCDFLDLPDGGLAQHLAQAADGVRQALLGQRPELLLCPSPLEVTADHRAAFAAAHVVLGSWRVGSGAAAAAGDAGGEAEMAGGEAAALAGLRILLYEVNQPAYPDLLVDVSAAEELLRRAMACYASQQERHPYLDAALGLRRFRTLSLGPGAGLAEAYRQLAIEDFTTRSPAQLVRHLGGEPALL
ncbi:MAG TPA: PIG-L family deacetylase, partial [Thermoanaerobaculia bacterium]|nr:PIG-L family deacetylase [Thermoanaerobaculia bacterium]